ncbi:MAG: hypothetical protein NVSMB27_40650 [Ktedonobacteraceae bacterium]
MQYISMGNTTTTLERTYTTATSTPPGPYVLVVDDDDAILSVIMLLLETENYAGLGFTDSPKVLPFLEQLDGEHLPSVILLDLTMPLVTGYELAAQLSQNKRFAHIPIIIMTADSRVRNASAVPGAAEWIGKPFQMQSLLNKLARYLSPPSE